MDSLRDGTLTSAEKDELMDKVKQEIALANFQELLTVSISVGISSVIFKSVVLSL